MPQCKLSWIVKKISQILIIYAIFFISQPRINSAFNIGRLYFSAPCLNRLYRQNYVIPSYKCFIVDVNSTSGPGCSKLTMSLVNVSLKFQTLISNIRQYFLLKKCEKLLQRKRFSHFFSTKNFSVFGYKVVKQS